MYVFELIFVNRSLAISQNIKFQAITCYEVLKDPAGKFKPVDIHIQNVEYM